MSYCLTLRYFGTALRFCPPAIKARLCQTWLRCSSNLKAFKRMSGYNLSQVNESRRQALALSAAPACLDREIAAQKQPNSRSLLFACLLTKKIASIGTRLR